MPGEAADHADLLGVEAVVVRASSEELHPASERLENLVRDAAGLQVSRRQHAPGTVARQVALDELLRV